MRRHQPVRKESDILRFLVTRPAALAVLLLFVSCSAEKEEPAAESTGQSGRRVDVVAPAPPEKPAYWERAGDFTANLGFEPNLTGSLNGAIAFVQNTLVGPGQDGKKRPLLVTDRAAYLLFVPKSTDHQKLEAVVDDGRGGSLTLALRRPENGARSDFNNMDGRSPVVFSKRAWNVVIPWNFMHPGMSITLRSGEGAEGVRQGGPPGAPSGRGGRWGGRRVAAPT